MENKLFLELQLSTGTGISLVGARAWHSKLVTEATVGEAEMVGNVSMSWEHEHQTFTLVLP